MTPHLDKLLNGDGDADALREIVGVLVEKVATAIKTASVEVKGAQGLRFHGITTQDEREAYSKAAIAAVLEYQQPLKEKTND